MVGSRRGRGGDTCSGRRNFRCIPRVAFPLSLARVRVSCSLVCVSLTFGTTRSSLTNFKTRAKDSANLVTNCLARKRCAFARKRKGKQKLA